MLDMFGKQMIAQKNVPLCSALGRKPKSCDVAQVQFFNYSSILDWAKKIRKAPCRTDNIAP